MTFNVGKNQKNYSFFMFFKIEMTFILESMGLHGKFPLETKYLILKAILSASNQRKNFSFPSTLKRCGQ